MRRRRVDRTTRTEPHPPVEEISNRIRQLNRILVPILTTKKTKPLELWEKIARTIIMRKKHSSREPKLVGMQRVISIVLVANLIICLRVRVWRIYRISISATAKITLKWI